MSQGERALSLNFVEQTEDHFASADKMSVWIKPRVRTDSLDKPAYQLTSRQRHENQSQDISQYQPCGQRLVSRNDFEINLAQEQAIPIRRPVITLLFPSGDGTPHPANALRNIAAERQGDTPDSIGARKMPMPPFGCVFHHQRAERRTRFRPPEQNLRDDLAQFGALQVKRRARDADAGLREIERGDVIIADKRGPRPQAHAQTNRPGVVHPPADGQ